MTLQGKITAPTRHRISVDAFHRMEAAGVFPPEMDLELIEGELIEMPADGHRTINWNAEINRWLVQSLPAACRVVPDKSLRIDAFSEPKPDFWVFDAALKVEDVTAQNVLLIIEVADTTFEFDRRKAAIYAEGGVRDYWLVDVARRRVLVFRPQGGLAGEPLEFAETEAAEALLIPGLAFRIADFPRLAEDPA